MLNGINTIIWDWNGTLLDDVKICVDSINALLRKRSLKEIDLPYYRDVFTFPVREYYEKLGFNFDGEAYETVAFEFMDVYLDRLNDAHLFDTVRDVLARLKRGNYRQAVLSAMEQDTLKRSITKKGIDKHFDIIMGMNDHYAHGKIDAAKQILNELNVKPSEVLLIGDTLHDYEVASGMGCSCLLISAGHQSYERLCRAEVPVIRSLEDFSV